MVNIADILPDMKGKDVYFYLNKERSDWNSTTGVELVLHFGGKRVSLPLDEDESLYQLASSLHHFIDFRNILISWRVKEVFSYIRGKTGIPLEIDSSVYDLSVVSSYFGDDIERPSSFKEAVATLKSYATRPGWRSFLDIYSEVYLPLSLSVLPAIETNCLTDNRKRMCVYPNYVVEGQANGRLKAFKSGTHSYNPHSLGPEEKASLRPTDYDEVFMCFDYKNMEVNVLRWLSGDEALGEMLDSGEDLYKGIWRKITKQTPKDSHRSICKDVFLPVVFGLGRAALAEEIGVSEENAARLIDSLCKTFPVAFDWVKSQSADDNNVATDAFGRRRKFKSKELYKIKNFVVQAPASMICLKKLVNLHESLQGLGRVGFHVHDGYCVLCKKKDINSVFDLGTKVLEEEEEMFPGLGLRTTCNFGVSLDSLQPLKKGDRV